MARYLEAQNVYIVDAANEHLDCIRACEGSDNYYDEVIEIDLDTLEPYINSPYTPDLSHSLSKFASNPKGHPQNLYRSWEAASLAKQAQDACLKTDAFLCLHRQ